MKPERTENERRQEIDEVGPPLRYIRFSITGEVWDEVPTRG